MQFMQMVSCTMSRDQWVEHLVSTKVINALIQ